MKKGFIIIIILLQLHFHLSSEETLKLETKRDFTPEDSKCYSYRIPVVNKAFELEINALNISMVVITDDLNFDVVKSTCQRKNDNYFCKEYIFPGKFTYYNNKCSMSNLRLHFCADKQAKITIESKTSGTCINLPMTLGSECSRLGDSCSNIYTCVNKCEFITCKTENNSFSACVPKDTLGICENLFGEKSTVTVKPCKSNKSNFDYESDEVESTFIKKASIIVLFVIILLLILSCYYRAKLSQDGVPPFTAPEFLPGFLFPHKQTKEFDFDDK